MLDPPQRNVKKDAVFLIKENQRLRRQLKHAKEKDLLLKEIHHRVKNNFQTISSLLSLQCSYLRDPAAMRFFREAQSRVKSMALLHQKLYQSGDLDRVPFADYLRSLAAELFRFYRIQDGVTLKVRAGKAALALKVALPLGLMVNELVANALKHAFPDGRAGLVEIFFRRDKGGGSRLVVSDSGVGLPPDFDPASHQTLGLQIVNALAEQLGSRLEVFRNGKTTFAVRLSPNALAA